MSDTLQSDKPVARTLCGFCATGNHEICAEKDGYIQFSLGVHAGNQCKCHDLAHKYTVERGSNPNATPGTRKTKR